MKKSTFTPAQIAGILEEFGQGWSAEELSREHGISKACRILQISRSSLHYQSRKPSDEPVQEELQLLA